LRFSLTHAQLVRPPYGTCARRSRNEGPYTSARPANLRPCNPRPILFDFPHDQHSRDRPCHTRLPARSERRQREKNSIRERRFVVLVLAWRGLGQNLTTAGCAKDISDCDFHWCDLQGNYQRIEGMLGYLQYGQHPAKEKGQPSGRSGRTGQSVNVALSPPYPKVRSRQNSWEGEKRSAKYRHTRGKRALSLLAPAGRGNLAGGGTRLRRAYGVAGVREISFFAPRCRTEESDPPSPRLRRGRRVTHHGGFVLRRTCDLWSTAADSSSGERVTRLFIADRGRSIACLVNGETIWVILAWTLIHAFGQQRGQQGERVPKADGGWRIEDREWPRRFCSTGAFALRHNQRMEENSRAESGAPPLI
jgi:hypothetical protein